MGEKLKIDRFHEKEVIKSILNDARKSNIEIAKEIGITRQTVSNIIKKLKNDGRIWGFSTILEPELLDNHFYLVLIKIKEDYDKEDLIKKISKSNILNQLTDENFRYTSYLHGRFDFMTSFYEKNINEAEKKINKVLKPFRIYLSEIYLHQALITFRRMGIVNPNLSNDISKNFNNK